MKPRGAAQCRKVSLCEYALPYRTNNPKYFAVGDAVDQVLPYLRGALRTGRVEAVLISICFAHGAAGAVEADADLGNLSLSALANVKVTSVSKSTESLQQAAASIFVITREAIRASAATSVVQALRLAPNLLVTQLTASSFVISARGFVGNPAAQSFANKLLILIDGRSVYTPLYSGVYADTIDVPLEDIERIEVISGPGATLWGANAMNGVVNIITRSAYSSKGAYADLGGGNLE